MNNRTPIHLLGHLNINKAILFGILILSALIAFEVFNFSTTEFALTDLLGDLSFLGVRWATILSIAFCGIDFAGIARLFTPEKGERPAMEAWYLLGAWLLAAIMNAALTWWGISIALVNHEEFKNIMVEEETILRYVPIFVALLVWLIRVLIIGTMSTAGDQIFAGPLFLPHKFRENTVKMLSKENWEPGRNKSIQNQRPIPSYRPNFRKIDSGPDEAEPNYQSHNEYRDPPTKAGSERKF